MMDLNQILAPVRPATQLLGSVCLIVGLAKFFGVDIPVGFEGLQLAVAGWLLKSV